MEEKRQKLIEKMSAELEAYRTELLTCSREEILQNAQDYCTREMILQFLPEIAVSEDVYVKLLAMEDALKEASECYRSVELENADAVSITLTEVAGCDTSDYIS